MNGQAEVKQESIPMLSDNPQDWTLAQLADLVHRMRGYIRPFIDQVKEKLEGQEEHLYLLDRQVEGLEEDLGKVEHKLQTMPKPRPAGRPAPTPRPTLRLREYTEQNSFANALDACIKKLGMNTQQVARKFGATVRTVNRWRSGQSMPRKETQAAIEEWMDSLSPSVDEDWI